MTGTRPAARGRAAAAGCAFLVLAATLGFAPTAHANDLALGSWSAVERWSEALELNPAYAGASTEGGFSVPSWTEEDRQAPDPPPTTPLRRTSTNHRAVWACAITMTLIAVLGYSTATYPSHIGNPRRVIF